MNIKIVKSKSEKDEDEYYLVGLECFEDFDIISNALVNIYGVIVIEILDGIYSRIGKYEKDGDIFKLIYHEDVGNYVTSIEQTVEKNEKLRKMLENIIPNIEKELG